MLVPEFLVQQVYVWVNGRGGFNIMLYVSVLFMIKWAFDFGWMRITETVRIDFYMIQWMMRLTWYVYASIIRFYIIMKNYELNLT